GVVGTTHPSQPSRAGVPTERSLAGHDKTILVIITPRSASIPFLEDCFARQGAACSMEWWVSLIRSWAFSAVWWGVCLVVCFPVGSESRVDPGEQHASRWIGPWHRVFFPTIPSHRICQEEDSGHRWRMTTTLSIMITSNRDGWARCAFSALDSESVYHIASLKLDGKIHGGEEGGCPIEWGWDQPANDVFSMDPFVNILGFTASTSPDETRCEPVIFAVDLCYGNPLGWSWGSRKLKGSARKLPF
ncbi:hypothetical protein QBC36DRAFT_366640, partial [Triangularia setosa]